MLRKFVCVSFHSSPGEGAASSGTVMGPLAAGGKND